MPDLPEIGLPPLLAVRGLRRVNGIRGNEREGTVFTHTTNAHPYNPAVPVPYNISIVELEEQVGLRFTTNVVEYPPEDVRIGMPMRVSLEQHGEVFVPDTRGSRSGPVTRPS